MAETKKATQNTEMMTYDKYAIIEAGGKQYQAVPGKTVALEKLEGEPGSPVEFKVLMKKDGANAFRIGQPYLEEMAKGTIVKHIKAPKVIVFKFKRRKKSRVKKGHRQPHTIVRFDG